MDYTEYSENYNSSGKSLGAGRSRRRDRIDNMSKSGGEAARKIAYTTAGIRMDVRSVDNERAASNYEWKYTYRNACAAIIIFLASVSFNFTWYEFVRINNQTGHLTGTGNLLMATIIYALLYAIIGKGMHAYKIGVGRITNTVVSQVLTALVVDAFEVFI